MNDKELMQKTYAAPLHEQLASVPENARLVIDDPDGMGTRFIPVGRLCREAAAALRERLAQEPVATPSRSFEDVYKVQTERLATERERADKAEQNYRLMIKNHVPRNIFDWNRRK